ASGGHDDWNGGGGLLGRQRGGRSGCRYNIDLETDQVRCEVRQSFEPIFRKAGLKNDVFSFYPSPLPQSSDPSSPLGDIVTCNENAYRVFALGLLRVGRQRPHRRAAEKRYELAALHSITSSASASSLSGIWTFAVLRLMASSNLFGNSTGRSAGFAPLRMRPAYIPGTVIGLRHIGRVAHKSPGRNVLLPGIHRGNAMLRREGNELVAVRGEECT